MSSTNILNKYEFYAFDVGLRNAINRRIGKTDQQSQIELEILTKVAERWAKSYEKSNCKIGSLIECELTGEFYIGNLSSASVDCPHCSPPYREDDDF